MLETLREYAHERLASRGTENGTALSHVSYYLKIGEQAEPELRRADQVAWLERLELEHDNFRAALRWSLQHRIDLALGIGAALWRFWEMRGHFTEGRAYLDEMLNNAETSTLSDSEKRARARALNGAANLAHDQSDLATARSRHYEALAILRQLGDRNGTSGSLNNLGTVATALRELELARSLYEESLAIKQEIGDQWGIGLVLLNLGVNALDRGDYLGSGTLLQESIGIMRSLGDRWGIAVLLNVQGNLARIDGNVARARSLYQESLAILQELGDRPRIALSLNNQGDLARLEGNHSLAHTLYREALIIARDMGYVDVVIASLEGFAGVAAALGQSELALQLAGASAGLRVALGTPLKDYQRDQLREGLAPAEQALGEDVCAERFQDGQALSADQAVALALEIMQ
jgi:tetratricopeptide (TPR) repeat protein